VLHALVQSVTSRPAIVQPAGVFAVPSAEVMTMAHALTYRVSSTFAGDARIHASTHTAALNRYIADVENGGRSYPEESMIRVAHGRDCRDYVCVDGFFEREC
jgi:L-alanine-DL-glutamate epimerase-like enolase superfamily enzyme